MTIPLFDAHCDTASALLDGGSLLENSGNLDLIRYRAYRPAAQVFAVWADGGDLRSYQTILSRFRRELEEHREHVRLCRSGGELRAAAESGALAALLSVEGAELLDCDPEQLPRAYADGVRIIHLCWNYDNALTGAAMDSGRGLTPLGRSFAQRMWQLGMLIDLSHSSETAFWELAEISATPLLAGHSNARSLCDHPRNLTDDQFRAIVRSGGIAGLNLYRDFVGLGADVEAVVEHAEHFLALGGEHSVCMGGDWDGVDDEFPAGIAGIQDAGRIYEAMLRRNWSEELVRRIFYENLMDFMERCL